MTKRVWGFSKQVHKFAAVIAEDRMLRECTLLAVYTVSIPAT